jgi:cytochrome b
MKTMSDANPRTMAQTDTRKAAAIKVWDPVVRMFHWSLVAAFAVAWLSAEELDRLHEIAGYVVFGLIALRVIWGFVGSHYARFAQFVRGPRALVSYLGDMARGTERRYIGHNPAGAAMVIALLVTLSGTAFTGWLMAEPDRLALLPDMPQIVAPAWADDDGDRESGAEGVLEEVHETLANLMLVLVALHVGGVVLASVRHRENLVRAMVTGEKRGAGPDDIG